jgi:ABC-type Fe3+ transport system permease subunit
MTAPEYRPAVVTAAFWFLLAGAVLLLVGGLTTATVSFAMLRQAAPSSYSDETLRNSLTVYRGAGVVVVLAGAGLSWLAARARLRDVRARRATLVLALTIVALIAVAAVFHLAPVSIFALMSVLPIFVGIVLLTRPAAAEWFAGGGPAPAADPDV